MANINGWQLPQGAGMMVKDDWPEPNYDNPVTRAPIPALIAAVVLMTGLSFTIVGLRVYCRRVLLRSFGVDDWLMVIALIPTLGSMVCAVLSFQYGEGRHIWDVPSDLLSKFFLISEIIGPLLMCALALSKLSLLFTYLRIPTPTSPLFHRLLIATGLLIVVLTLGTFVATRVVACSPEDPDCTPPPRAAVMGTGLVAILIDFWLVALPQPYLWRLRLPRRERAVVIALTSLGVLAATACIVRHHYLIQNHDSQDPTWDGHSVWVWSLAELHLDIVCASVPPLRALARHWFPALEGSVSGRKRGEVEMGCRELDDVEDVAEGVRIGERRVRFAE